MEGSCLVFRWVLGCTIEACRDKTFFVLTVGLAGTAFLIEDSFDLTSQVLVALSC